ncbi:MAG: hypothetical protein MJ240_09730 [Kiritimatiellae bacterium]|nr:hypothetical protein [Kiritimatiellia bacterium]
MSLGVVVGALVSATSAALPDIASSPLFTARTDTVSRVVSYVLKPVAGFNQQHPYFNNKAMTDDGRFIVLAYADDEATGTVTNEGQKALAVVDIAQNRVVKLPDIGRFSIPFLDVTTARLYCADRTDESMAMFDLKANPAQKIRLCDLPQEILALGPVKRWYTHLTLTADRTRAYLDTSVDAKRWIQGLLRFSDGSFEKWGETDFPCGHSQICPVNDRIAYGGRSQPGKHRVPDPKHPGQTMLVPIPKERPYPCMWLMRPGEKPRMIPSRDINHSTHQNWFEDGRGWYWCSRLPGPGRRNYTKWGVYAYDLATDAETKISSEKALHATISADRSAIVYDWPDPHWSVSYQNLQTKKVVPIHSAMPDYFLIRAKSSLHADPHPQFVCRDRWILSMVIVDEGKRLTVAVTPVDQLEEKTK